MPDRLIAPGSTPPWPGAITMTRRRASRLGSRGAGRGGAGLLGTPPAAPSSPPPVGTAACAAGASEGSSDGAGGSGARSAGGAIGGGAGDTAGDDPGGSAVIWGGAVTGVGAG